MTTSENRPTLRERQEIARVWRRRRDRAFLYLVGPALIGVGALLLTKKVIQLPDGVNEHVVVGVGYVFVVLFFFAFRRSLACPACGGRVWPPRAAVCRHCGIALTDTTAAARFSAPAETSPSPLASEEARKELAEKMKVFGTLRRYERFMYYVLIPVSLSAGGWLYSGSRSPVLWVSLFAAAVIYLVGWFLFIYLVHTVCFAVFWITRAKCPHCGTRFSRELVAAVPGHIVLESYVPDFCTGCGCRFRPTGKANEGVNATH